MLEEAYAAVPRHPLAAAGILCSHFWAVVVLYSLLVVAVQRPCTAIDSWTGPAAQASPQAQSCLLSQCHLLN